MSIVPHRIQGRVEQVLWPVFVLNLLLLLFLLVSHAMRSLILVPADNRDRQSANTPLMHLLVVKRLLLILALLTASAHATPPSGFVQSQILRPDGQSWNEAISLEFDPSGRLWVGERGGRIWILDDPHAVNTDPFIDISDEVGAWRDHGMADFALDPNFEQTGFVYLFYLVDRHHLLHCVEPASGVGAPICDAGYDPATNDYFSASIGRITRYQAKIPEGESDYHHAREVDYSTRKVLVGETAQTGFPSLYESHTAGTLLFGDDDTLLASFGDGASFRAIDWGDESDTYEDQALEDGIITPKEDVGALRSQLVDTLSGKIVRINPVTGDGVQSNPFFDGSAPRSPRSRVWLLGLRNPFRMTLRPFSGDHLPELGNPGVLYIGDVGWNSYEEQNIAETGGINFGWPLYEGMDEHEEPTSGSSYFDMSVDNLDMPNPLFGVGGCTEQFFKFNDLIRQDTLSTDPLPNPCDNSQPIPASISTFSQRRPALAWFQNGQEARWSTYDGIDAEQPLLGQSNSAGTKTVTGNQFRGNTSVGGAWYTETSFPAQYQNTYFFADYGRQWIRNAQFDENDQLVAVQEFDNDTGGVVSIEVSPVDGSLYYISWATFLNKVEYQPTGNQDPVAIATSDINFGTAPFAVQFTGSGSTDTEGQPLIYEWDFGDGSPVSNVADPTHTFTTTDSSVTNFTVTLTVTDDGGATDQQTLLISANNSPPTITSVTPPDGTVYPVTGNTVYELDASFVDAESSQSQLSCAWLTVLNHDNHTHQDPADSNCTTTTVISPLGCELDTYSFTLFLTVSDPHGLSVTQSIDLLPDCAGESPLADAGPDQIVNKGLLVTLDGSNSSDASAPIASYQWLQTGGSIPITFDTTSAVTTFTAPIVVISPEDYTFRLKVTDNQGFISTDTVTITVADTPVNTTPVAEAGPPQGAIVGQAISLAGSFTDDGIAGPVTVSWASISEPPGGVASIVDSSSLTSDVSFNVAGDYVLELTVEDTEFTDTDTVTITVADTPVARDIMLVARRVSVTEGDVAVVSQLQSLGHTVTVFDDDVVFAGDETGFDLVVISSTVSSSKVATKFRLSTIPVVTWEPYLYDDMGMTGTVAGTDYGLSFGEQNISVVNSGHPLAGGLSAGTTALSSVTTNDFGWGVPESSAVIIATISGQPTEAAIFAYDSGDTMPGLTAPARRVGLAMGNDTGSTWTADAQALFNAAINWALGGGVPVNQAPIVDAGTGQTVDEGELASLNGIVSDDGVSLPLAINWSVFSSTSSGTVTFTDSGSPTTTFSIDTAGTYELQLEANDPDFTVNDRVTITVIDTPVVSNVMLVAGNNPAADGDIPVIAQLQALGHAITVFDDDAVLAGDETGFDLIVISSTVTSSKVASEFRLSAIPVVSWESFVYDDMGMTGTVFGVDYGTRDNEENIDVINSSHPLAAGLSGTTTLSSLATQSFGWGAPGPSAVIIATISGQPGEASIFAYDSGDGMFGLTAPARRVGLAMGNDTASTWTADAQVLFNAAINWALGL